MALLPPSCWLPVAAMRLGLRPPALPPSMLVTTFLPITEFTKSCGRPCATVGGPDAQPRSAPRFPAPPGDLVRLQKADVLRQDGRGPGTFLDKLIVNADNSGPPGDRLQPPASPPWRNMKKDANKTPDMPTATINGHDQAPINSSHVLARSPPRRPAGGHHPRWPDRPRSPTAPEQFSANAACLRR